MGYILVIEDDEATVDVINLILSMEGHEGIYATNGADALKVIKNERPDLILLDLMMPIMDGETFLERYCKQPDHAPIIVLTAHVQALDSLPGCVDAGLAKPFELQDLLTLMRELIPG